MKALLLLLIIFTSCVEKEQNLNCESDELFSENEKKCTKAFGPTSFTLSIKSPYPSESYIASTNDSALTHSVVIRDDFQNGFSLEWILTKPSGEKELLGTGLSQVFTQSNYPVGQYSITLYLYDLNKTKVIETKSWDVTLISESTPTITQDTASPITTTETSGPSIINSTINNPGLISDIYYQWSVNGVDIPSSSGVTSASTFVDSFTFIANTSLSYYDGLGEYDLSLTLRDATTKALYTSSTWTVNANLSDFAAISLGNSTSFSTTTPNTSNTLTMINSLALSAGALKFDTDSDGSLDNIDICVQADDIQGVSGQGVYVDFYNAGNIIATAPLVANNTPLCLEDVLPSFSQSIPSTSTTELKTIKAMVYDRYIGFSDKQSYRSYSLLETYTWSVSVRQQNLPSSLTIIDTNSSNNANTPLNNEVYCDSKTQTSFLNCTLTQGAPGTIDLTLKVTDEDFDPGSDFNDIAIEFYLNGVLLDGGHELSSTDCVFNYTEVSAISDYTCSIALNSYSNVGPIDPTNKSYTVNAIIRDRLNPFGANYEVISNSVSWHFSTINDYNNPISIDTVTNSGSLTESGTLNFNFNVNDADSDSFIVELFRGSEIKPVETYTFISSDNQVTKNIDISHTLLEDTVSAVQSNSVNFTIKVTDIPHSGLSATTANDSSSLTIINSNPNPIFNVSNFSPSISDNLIGFSGLPLTIDPGEITDSSLLDGTNIKYQWLINVDENRNGDFTDDSGFVAISGATDKVLIWIPGQQIDFSNFSGTNVKIKLCLGDDGIIDGTSDSKNPEAQNTCPNALAALDSSSNNLVNTWNIQVFSSLNSYDGSINSFNSSANLPLGELATWLDDSNEDFKTTYTAYVSSTKDIIIEKVTQHSDGTKSGTLNTALDRITMSFSPESATTHIIKDLSINGDSLNKKLYLAYNVDTVPSSGSNTTHIRVLDISKNKPNFSDGSLFGEISSYSRGGPISTNAITSSDSSKILLEHSKLSSEKPTIIKFTAAAASATDISFNSPKSGISILFNQGVKYCTSTCSDIESTSLSLVSAINAETDNEFTNISASYNRTKKHVEITGLSDDHYFSVISNDPQNPYIVNPDHNQINILSTLVAESVTINALTITAGSDICNPSCTDNITAANELTDFINNSTSKNIQGVSASHISGTGKIILKGITNSNFYINDLNAKKLGKIEINHTTQKWYIPFIDGNNSDKLSILRGSYLNDLYYSESEVINFDTISASLTELAQTKDTNESLLIALKSNATEAVSVYEINKFQALIDSLDDVFDISTNSEAISNLRFATNSIDKAMLVGIIPAALRTLQIGLSNNNYDFLHSQANLNLATGFDIISSLEHFELTHSNDKDRFIMAGVSDPVLANDFEIFLLSLSSDNNTLTIDCSFDSSDKLNNQKCMRITPSSSSNIFNLKIAINNPSSEFIIGTSGSASNENKGYFIPFAFHIDDGGANIETDAQVLTALINTKQVKTSADENNNEGNHSNLGYFIFLD